MTFRPPRHLGLKSSWTEEMETDWIAFQEQRQRKNIDRIIDLFQSKMCSLLILGRFMVDWSLGYSWSKLLFASMSSLMILMRSLLYVFGPVIRRTLRNRASVADVVQLGILLMLSCSHVVHAVSMGEDLTQHRCFLMSQIQFVGVINWMHLPFRLQTYGVTPILVCSWLVFHGMVGYRTAAVMLATLFTPVLQAFLCALSERLQWQQFHAIMQLDRERRVLEATQVTLQGMLSSFWDASCTCNMDGDILSSTPHLEQLLGRGRHLVGSRYTFLTNESDHSRLQAFLQSTIEGQQASNLQCTMQSLGDGSGQDLREVVVYGVRLPPGSTLQSCGSDLSLDKYFIGIKEIQSDARVPDATDTMSEAVAIIRSKGDVLDDEQVSWTSDDDVLVGDISTRRESDRQVRLGGVEVQSVSSRCTSLAYSRGTSVATSASHKASYVSVGTETVMESTSCSGRRPPLPPQQSASRIPIKFQSGKRSQSTPPRMALPKKKFSSAGPAIGSPYLPSAEYLSEACLSILEDIVHSLNFDFQDCCAWHAAISKVESWLQQLTSWHRCVDDWRPPVAWQCQKCTAIHGTLSSAGRKKKGINEEGDKWHSPPPPPKI